MNAYLLPGGMGLLLGLLLHWTTLDRPAPLRQALGLHRSLALRSALTAVGWSMALTALLCWLAVIDVDRISVLPLSLGSILGGLLLGVGAGLCGFTPTTAFAGLGGSSSPLEALCVLLGCGVCALLLPSLEGILTPLFTAAPYAHATLFKVTLDEDFLLGGGFLGQACAGLLPIVIALCIPSPRPVILTEEAIADRAAALSPTAEEDEASTDDAAAGDEAPLTDADEAPALEDTAEDTLVITLPEEEPLVIDTALDEADGEETDASVDPEASGNED